MKFRDYPKLSNKGAKTVAAGMFQRAAREGSSKGNRSLGGCDGVLHESCRIFLTIEHRRTLFVGVLFVEDKSFCLRVYEFLKSRIGSRIKQIAEVDSINRDLTYGEMLMMARSVDIFSVSLL